MPTRETIVLTRQELFDLVWANPLSALAKELGVSDVTLGKTCRKLDIPLPGVGYWRKVEVGQKPKKPRFPNPKDTRTCSFCFTRYEPGETIEEPPQPVVPDYAIYEGLPKNKIVVPETLRNPHPLIAQTKEALKRMDDTPTGRDPYPRYNPCLEIQVSKEAGGRALRIMNALLKALEARGISVAMDKEDRKRQTCAMVRNEKIAFGMYEASRQSKQYDAFWKSMRTVLTPCGELVLRVHGQYSYDVFQMRDGKRPLEDRLNDFVIALYDEAESRKAWRAERERREMEAEQHRRAEEERRKQKEAQEAKIKGLYGLVDSWRRAREVREFLNAVDDAHQPNGGIAPESELGQWMVWARNHADHIDPLVPSKDKES